MKEISANEIKTRGIKAISELTEDESEVVVTVRGKREYVLMPLERFNRLREMEIEYAVAKAKQEISEGKFYEESVDEHINRITNG